MTDYTKLNEAIALWRAHPAQMVRDLFQVEPDAWQVEALEAFPHTRRLAMKACAGPGKTATLSWIGWNFMLTRPHPMIGTTSISGANLKSGLWTEFARWRAKSPLLMQMFEQTDKSITSIEEPMTWRCEARTWPKDADSTQIGNALAGVHAKYVMWLLDETGDYPASIMPVCEGIFNGDPIEAHIVQAGNPTRRSGPLWRASSVARNLWKVVEITADPDDPKRTPRVSIEVAKEQIAQYGRENPWVKVRIFGEFPDTDFNALIGPDEVAAAMRRYYREGDIGNAALVFGIDVARFGDDQSVIAPRRGIQAFPMKKFRNLDSTQGSGIVARMWEDQKADGVFIDNAGLGGGGWIDALIRLGRTPIGIDFGGKAHDSTRYYNKRAEMYFDAVAWIKRGGALPDSPELLAALTQTTFSFSRDSGRLILEPKESVKAKLGYSPDEADAFCFVAGTMIETPSGPRPIEDIGPGDKVITPFGASIVAFSWMRFADRISTVTLTNGSVLKGRPEHDIFVYGHGKVRLDALSLTMDLSPLSERWKWVSASALFTAARSIGFKTLVGTLPRGSVFTASACCIAASGLSAMDRFRRAMRSITRIVTGATATSTTLHFLPTRTTQRSTAQSEALLQRQSASSIYQPPEKQPKHGMRHPKGLSGIESMASKVGRDESEQGAFASDAELHSGRFTQPELSTAPRVAARLTPIADTRPMFERAIGVAARLLRTATGTQHVAPASVQTESVPLTDVYNLTLERDNAYYANGILVFNCLTFAEPVQPIATGIRRPVRSAVQQFDPFKDLNKAVQESYNPYSSNIR